MRLQIQPPRAKSKRRLRLPHSVMVAREILNLFVKVRILVRQPFLRSVSRMIKDALGKFFAPSREQNAIPCVPVEFDLCGSRRIADIHRVGAADNRNDAARMPQ